MIYVVLTVITSVFLLTAFKLFDIFKINTFHAIVVNYLTASVTGYVTSKHDIVISQIYTHSWIFLCIPLGFLFISVFFLISLTTQRISISAAAVANKMSVVLPVLFSIIIIGDEFSFIKIFGVLLALAAVYLTTSSRKSKKPSNNVQWWLPVLVFIGSGCIDISINAAKQYFLVTSLDEELFGICTFASAFCIGLLFLLFQLFSSKESFFDRTNAVRTVFAGLILGIPNYFSIYFIIKALDSGVFTSAQLFPVLNISNVVLSALIGVLFFKEKLSAMNGFGIALAIASIGLIAL